MKNSGIEWIGNIPDSWSLSRLQWHLSEIKESNDPVKTMQVLSLTNKLGVIPYEEKGDHGNKAKENLNEYKLAYPGTIVANSMNILIGSVGKCNYYGCVSPVYYVFKPNDGENIDFLNYVFQTEQFQKELRRYANGILEIRLRVSASDILKCKIAFPSSEEQVKIVNVLDDKIKKIDSLIDIEKKQIEVLSEYKETVIAEAVTKGIHKNQKMKESGIKWIGCVPETYSMSKMGRIADYKKGPFGSSLKISMFVDKATDTYKVYEQKNAIYKDATLGSYYISKQKFEELSSNEVRPGDIIVSCAGTIGECYQMPSNMEPGIINQALMRVRLSDGIDSQYFLYLFDAVISKASQTASNGSAMKNIPPFDVLKNMRIFLPDLNAQIEVVSMLNTLCLDIDSLVTIKQKKISILEEFKKSLIYEYITGKKEVA